MEKDVCVLCKLALVLTVVMVVSGSMVARNMIKNAVILELF